MSIKKFELSEKKIRMCFMALYLAAESENALIDSYHGLTDRESKKVIRDTKASAKRYRKLRAELGEMLGSEIKTPLEKAIENATAVPISQIKEMFIKD